MTIHIRFQRFPVRAVRRDITARRLSASQRALQRQRDKLPLFSKQVAARQPTPLERIINLDTENQAYWVRLRKHECQQWLEVRRIIRREICSKFRRVFLGRWNKSSCPGCATYAMDFLLQIRRELCAGCSNLMTGGAINCKTSK